MNTSRNTTAHKALRSAYARELVAPRVDDAGKRRGVARSVKSLAKGLPQWRSGRLPEDIDPWVWSDQHLGHANIIEYCNRPFRDVAEMDETFFSAWEAHVEGEDWVVFVGDLAMGNALHPGTFERVHGLPGKRKILVPGNHDVTGRGGLLRAEGFDAYCSQRASPNSCSPTFRCGKYPTAGSIFTGTSMTLPQEIRCTSTCRWNSCTLRRCACHACAGWQQRWWQDAIRLDQPPWNGWKRWNWAEYKNAPGHDLQRFG